MRGGGPEGGGRTVPPRLAPANMIAPDAWSGGAAGLGGQMRDTASPVNGTTALRALSGATCGGSMGGSDLGSQALFVVTYCLR